MDVDKLKRDKLADILRRLVANPGNVMDVAEQIALDWFPMMKVDEKGEVTFVVGDGRRR